MAVLNSFVRSSDLHAAFVLTCVGSVTEATVRFAYDRKDKLEKVSSDPKASGSFCLHELNADVFSVVAVAVAVVAFFAAAAAAVIATSPYATCRSATMTSTLRSAPSWGPSVVRGPTCTSYWEGLMEPR